MATAISPREHVEEIRRVKFSIGGEPNPVREDLHQAVKNLAGELYAKDVHFLMEIIQNAEDNEYPEGVKPSLEFIVTSKDITDTGAEATLLIFNSEKGFSPKNVESICSVGRSTKKGQRKKGYIGEKGIGFKSVFLITAQPYIFSNGYQIRFSEEPCPECDIGYIVPEWVEDSPTLPDIQEIYGSAHAFPTTTIILPLKPDKVEAVKRQLSSIHPEVLLFLSKIQHLSVREHNEDSKQTTVSAVSISTETELVVRKNIAAESYMLRLSANEKSKSSERECSYYMWRQKFPVKHENRVDRRMEIDELLITLAFPMERRLNRGTTSPGIYAFLPTEMITNFPFIIQADFLLASSRETILLDNKWNQGILDSVPSAFACAFDSLIKGSEGVPASTLASFFNFLPIESSSYAKLNGVRDSIRNKIVQENIIPSESFLNQMFFHKPCEVGRILPAFWDILTRARKQGVTLYNLSSNGKFALNSAFDSEKYDEILEFLGVTYMDNECYIKCIQGSNMASRFPECDYLTLLCFVADNWLTCFHNTNMKHVPLLRYIIQDGNISLLSVAEATQHLGRRICLSYSSTYISWLIDWNKEFRHVANHFFMPKATQVALRSSDITSRERTTVCNWLKEYVGVRIVNINDYATQLLDSLNNDRRLVLAFAHFVCHSLSKDYISSDEANNLCKKMPLLVTDNSGCVATKRSGVLLPAKVSNWVKLIGSNPWGQRGYVELREDYLLEGYFAGVYSSEDDIVPFLSTHVGASDIPYLCPPDDAFPAVYSPLTKENAFLLLDWIRNLRNGRILADGKFLRCIKEGAWLRTQIGGSSSYKPPSHSFLLTPSWGNLLQSGSEMVDIPLIDQGFYGNRISEYKEELKAIGVMSEFGEACEYIGNHLMLLASYTNLTRANVFSILNFIRFLRSKYLSPKDFIDSIKGGRWLMTCHGERSPDECIIYDSDWKAAAQISNLPFIDQQYYGEKILNFHEELQLLGVVVCFDPKTNYNRIADNFRLPAILSSLTADATLLILQCIRNSKSSDRLVSILQSRKWLKTSHGLKSPGECFLPDPEWGCILKIFNCFPLISQDFCGNAVSTYKSELKKLGVKVDFEEAVATFIRAFKERASSSSITKENVFSLLTCYRKLKEKSIRIPSDLPRCIREHKWLQTRLGLRTPKESILFNSDWEHLLPISWLPFIDDTEKGYGSRIREYKDELKALEVIVELKKGARFITTGIIIPSNPAGVTPKSVFALLKCIRYLLETPSDGNLPKEFHDRIGKKWLNTSLGYRAPAQCVLFGSNWSSDLQRKDGPFISEEFYGSELVSYQKELNAIGVTIDVAKGCQLIAGELHSHSHFNTIARIYNYLMKFNWKPEEVDANWIWIPNGSDDGEWVSPQECVLHDRDGLFGQQLNVLDKHYGKELLNFFSTTLEVKNHPSVDDYWNLWSGWEDSRDKLTSAECLAFWVFISKHWSFKTQKLLYGSLTKLPVPADSDTVLLIDKDDVFIPDDLLLKHLFEGASADSLFVWYPQRSSSSLPWTKLHGVYSDIGVRSISESVRKIEHLLSDELLTEINPIELPIWKELIRLILAFLADPSLEIDAGKRQQTAKALLDVKVFESKEPILVSYSLELCSGETVEVNASRKIRWDRERSMLFTQCMDRSSRHKDNIEFASYFSQVVAEGLLWDKEERIAELSELIKLGWMLEFEEEAIGFLMKSKNLQLFLEDEEFLQSAFSQKSLCP